MSRLSEADHFWGWWRSLIVKPGYTDIAALRSWRECVRRRYEPLKEIVRSLIIAYDSGDMTAVEGLLNEAQELVK